MWGTYAGIARVTRWLSGEQAARHLGISASAVRKRASSGKLPRREVRPGVYEYGLSDEEIDLDVTVDEAVETSGTQLLAQVIERSNETLQTAIEAINGAHQSEVSALREMIDALRSQLARAEREIEEKRLREAREREEREHRESAWWRRFW